MTNHSTCVASNTSLGDSLPHGTCGIPMKIFVPLTEVFVRTTLNSCGLLRGKMLLWGQRFSQEFHMSLQFVPALYSNYSLCPGMSQLLWLIEAFSGPARRKKSFETSLILILIHQFFDELSSFTSDDNSKDILYNSTL